MKHAACTSQKQQHMVIIMYKDNNNSNNDKNMYKDGHEKGAHLNLIDFCRVLSLLGLENLLCKLLPNVL